MNENSHAFYALYSDSHAEMDLIGFYVNQGILTVRYSSTIISSVSSAAILESIIC